MESVGVVELFLVMNENADWFPGQIWGTISPLLTGMAQITKLNSFSHMLSIIKISFMTLIAAQKSPDKVPTPPLPASLHTFREAGEVLAITIINCYHLGIFKSESDDVKERKEIFHVNYHIFFIHDNNT